MSNPIGEEFEILCERAAVLHRQNQFSEAEALFEQALRRQPEYFPALHSLGLIAAQTNRPERAVQWLEQAVACNPHSAAALTNQGNVLCRLNRHVEAIQSFDQAIALNPGSADAYYNRGNALRDSKRYEEAIDSYEQAIAARPGIAEFHYNQGLTFFQLRRYESAIASFDRAIALKPAYAQAYNNRGSALFELKQSEAAIHSYDRALALNPDHAETYHNRAIARFDLQDYQAAIADYDQALARNPDHAEAHHNRGCILLAIKQYEAALASFEKALALKPMVPDTYLNCGLTLFNLKRHEAAIKSYDQAIALQPDMARAYSGRGAVLLELMQHEAAIDSYRKAIALNPSQRFLCGQVLQAKMQICDWRGWQEEIAELAARVEREEAAANPFSVLSLLGSERLQSKAARVWVREECKEGSSLPAIARHGRGEKIRVGYFSGDFRIHPVSILAAQLFELHDRSRFELTAFSFGPDTKDEMRERVERAFNRFIDVRHQSDRQVAELARSLQIDIAVDLGGFTQDSRPRIFAERAAPLQVSYLGYAATTGAAYMDYLIADGKVIPPGSESHYREKIIYLPHSFLPNDTTRPIAGPANRAQLHLPESGFVFCSFNNSYKITPPTFDSWMRILKRVPGSVLWLGGCSLAAAEHLRQEAQHREVDAQRLVFAPRLASLAEHLARHQAADLFLDTLPYNAHTTACDALWAGLPVLTRYGESFAGRVAASLLDAIGLPELIATTRSEYEELAVALANDPPRLKHLKERLARNRITEPLFDTPRLTRHVEAGFGEIFERGQSGLSPDHIRVPAQPRVQAR